LKGERRKASQWTPRVRATLRHRSFKDKSRKRRLAWTAWTDALPTRLLVW